MGRWGVVAGLTVLAATAGCGVPGEPATWSVREWTTITPETTVIPVRVSGRACNGGEPEDVIDPLVETTAETVTVIYRVEPVGSSGGTCVGVPGTEARLQLPSPLGERELVDGGCDEERDAESCVRWSPWETTIEVSPVP